MPNLKVNIFQFDIQWLNPGGNILQIQRHLESLQGDADLVVLPEMFLSGFCMEPSQSAVFEEGEEIAEIIKLASAFNTAIMGSLAIREKDKYYNRVLLISKEGIIGRYDKQYLYSPSGESKVFDSVYDTNLILFKGWHILPQVCYDLRFPENVRKLPAPDLLVYMANWPLPRIYHWDTLLKARSIENQCFTIGCNRLGEDGNQWEYPGHSVVIQPDGASILSKGELSSEIFELSLEVVKAYRSKYRFLHDKKNK
jgi:predicted amidohydrolase